MIETWIALVLIWTPMMDRSVDREFRTEKECWDYYKDGIGESKWGEKINHSATVRPDGNYHWKLSFDFPIRMYEGKDGNKVWLSCERKQPKIFNK